MLLTIDKGFWIGLVCVGVFVAAMLIICWTLPPKNRLFDKTAQKQNEFLQEKQQEQPLEKNPDRS